MTVDPYRVTPPSPEPAPPADEQTRLGSVRSVHAPPPSGLSIRALLLNLAVSFGVGTLLFLAVGGSSLEAALLLGAVVLVTMVGWWWTRRKPQSRVTLHAGGVVVERPGARDAVIFDDVDALWLECEGRGPWYMRTTFITGVRLNDHSGASHPIPVEGLTACVEIVSWLWRHCSRPLVAEARRALKAGETLTFARVQFDATGIAVDGVRVPWAQMRLVRLQQGRVVFCRRSTYWAWKTIPIQTVPHPGVFLTLIREAAPRVEVDMPFWLRASGE